MNYLAHIFLSGSNKQLQIGNFIGDFVKGSQYNEYPKLIKEGILLHRQIDHYTDNHPNVIELKNLLRPTFGRYSGLIADMYFDYFIAIHFRRLSNSKNLNLFAFSFYFHTLLNYRILPKKVKNFIFHFILSNRLGKYATVDGLHESLVIMRKYKTSSINPDLTVEFLIRNITKIENLFNDFIPDLIAFTNNKIEKIHEKIL